MPITADSPPTTEQLQQLRQVVLAVAERRGLDEPFAYVWLCDQVFGSEREPLALTSGDCDKLIAWRLGADA